MKQYSLGTIIVSGLIGGLIMVGLSRTYRDSSNKESEFLQPPTIQRPGAIYIDNNDRREYIGKARVFDSGAEQKVYVDRVPFGSLDGVRTRQWPRDNSRLEDLPERPPRENEEDTFLVLEDYGRKEHALLQDRAYYDEVMRMKGGEK